MQFQILQNGNLQISIEGEEDREELETVIQRYGSGGAPGALCDLLEFAGLMGNGWGLINPADVGALTDSPILTDDYTVEDGGSITVHGRVWWFPNYMVESYLETLRDTGVVIFTLGE